MILKDGKMLKLLKNADVYAPEHLGRRDILIAGERIAALAPSLAEYEGIGSVEVLDIRGDAVVPGYIDLHEHVTGGGGEQGPASRVPELGLCELIESGVTTSVGLLGTDGITRSLGNLLAKVRALREEGITAYMLTGSYAYPAATLTDSVERDIVLIGEIVGAKVAVSDHRGSNPTGEELIRLASEVRRGSMLAGRAGILCMHMGGGNAGMDPIFYAVDHSDIPIRTFLPTHMARSERLLREGEAWIRRGGMVDITAGDTEEKAADCAQRVAAYLQKVDPAHVTISSDGGGSMPRFNEHGVCTGLTYASPRGLHRQLKKLLREEVAMETALCLLTANPAAVLGTGDRKGHVAAGCDADLLVLDAKKDIRCVFARGQTAMWDKEVRMKGRFET